ncbi:MAG: 50S ribosomal protein L6 [archaeon]|nr:MAG: 50S ribosomal protein L6 [archaeon]
MKKDLEKVIDIPEGIQARIDGGFINLKGPLGEDKRKIKLDGIKISFEDKKIILKKGKANKKDKKLMNSLASHIANLIKGVQKKYEYVLEICSVHFPMNVKAEKDKLVIKNFLGERKEKTIDIMPEIEIEVKGNHVYVRSINKEKAGLQASIIEKISRIVEKDRRVFQDGIWIVKKEKGRHDGN